MPERPLLIALSKWIGRNPTQRALEKKGFIVHKSWQLKMVQFCGEEKTALLNRYWDEVAMETIGSAGQGDPNARRFAIQPEYHSQFLDELVEKVDFAEPAFRYPPPIRCLFEYRKKLKTDTEFRFDETAFFENLKKLEGERLAVHADRWTGKKRDAVPYMSQFAGMLGFENYNKGYRKRTKSGLVFRVRPDLGGRPDCLNLPLIFSISHEEEPNYTFDIGLFERIVPGFDRYAYWESPTSFVLGMRAHIELFEIIASSFDGK